MSEDTFPDVFIAQTLHGHICYLVTSTILALFSLRIHSIFKTIHCMVCGSAWIPSSLTGHLKTHGFTLTTQQSEELQSELVIHDIKDTSNIAPPLPGGPPIEGLSVVSNGHCCTHCTYCSPTFNTFETHWCKKHPDITTPARDAFILGDIQTFFRPSPQRWFRVNAALTALQMDDPFAIYLQKQVPQFTSSTMIASATHVREIPPLLQVTGWHLHLQDYTEDKDKIEGLRKLMALPSLRNSSPLFVSLKETVFQYMGIVRENARQSAIGIKHLLMECPRQVFKSLF